MANTQNFYLTVGLPVRHAKFYEQKAEDAGLSLNRYIAKLVDEHREAMNRADAAERKLAESQAGTLHYITNMHRLMGAKLAS